METEQSVKRKLNQQDEEIQSEQLSSSLVSDTTVEEEEVLMLKDSQNKNMFLTKIGIVGILYILCIAGTVWVIKFDMRTAKQWDRIFKIQKNLFWYLLTIGLIKVVIGLVGKVIESLVKIIFVIDCMITVIATLGLYIYLDEYQRIYFIQEGYYVEMFAISALIIAVCFTLCTFYKDKETIFNYKSCIFISIVSFSIGLKCIDEFILKTPLKIRAFIITILLFAAVIIYLPINSYLLVNYRGDKYNTNQYLIAYYSYYVDFLFSFWSDIFINMDYVKRHKKKRNRKKRRKQKIQRKEQRKDNQNNQELIQDEIKKDDQNQTKQQDDQKVNEKQEQQDVNKKQEDINPKKQEIDKKKQDDKDIKKELQQEKPQTAEIAVKESPKNIGITPVKIEKIDKISKDDFEVGIPSTKQIQLFKINIIFFQNQKLNSLLHFPQAILKTKIILQ